MVTKKPRAAKNSAVSKGLVSPPSFEMTFTDFRVIKIVAERFLSPEDAKTGTYGMKIENNSCFISSMKEGDEITMSYNVEINGHRVDLVDGERKRGPKSFLISAAVEGKIECLGGPASEELIEKYSLESVRILHALTVNRLRDEATQLGYRTVRPSLGLTSKQMPKLTVEVASNEAS